jgi:hypothetical protein
MNLFKKFMWNQIYDWLTKSSVQLPDVENEQWVVSDEHDDDDDVEDDNDDRFRYKCWINSVVIFGEFDNNW